VTLTVAAAYRSLLRTCCPSADLRSGAAGHHHHHACCPASVLFSQGHHHGFAPAGVDLARHDRAARLVSRQFQLGEAGAWTRGQPADVVRDLHQAHRQATQGRRGGDDAIQAGVAVLSGLREIEAGQYEGQSEATAGQQYEAAPLAWLHGNRSARIPGSINGDEFESRLNDAVKTIYDSGETNPIAFSHSLAIMFWVLMNVKSLYLAPRQRFATQQGTRRGDRKSEGWLDPRQLGRDAGAGIMTAGCLKWWDWAPGASWRRPSGTCPVPPPTGPCCAPSRPADPTINQTLKGGSHLCAPEYCHRYRAPARSPQSQDSATTHIGFRCVTDCG
jgi:Histidine phosphatase superfamily (branch 1)/Sulfatase-modifying factor enzyme 1